MLTRPPRRCQSGRPHVPFDALPRPDDQGLTADGQAALGMVRLAIIDLVSGKQPMANDDGSVTIVFNGEIYNFRNSAHPCRNQVSDSRRNPIRKS